MIDVISSLPREGSKVTALQGQAMDQKETKE